MAGGLMSAYIPAGSGSGLPAVQLPLSQAAVVAPLPNGSIAANFGASSASAGADASSGQPEPQQVDVRRGAVQLPDWAARQPSVVWLRVQAGEVLSPLRHHGIPQDPPKRRACLRRNGLQPTSMPSALQSVCHIHLKHSAAPIVVTCSVQPRGWMRRSWCESRRRAPGQLPPPQHPAGCCPTQAACQRSSSAMVRVPRQRSTSSCIHTLLLSPLQVYQALHPVLRSMSTHARHANSPV